jgi:hypothetical protein
LFHKILFLFFSDGNGTDFLAEQEEDLVYFVESQRFLSLFQFSYESEVYARFRRQIYLGQSDLIDASFLPDSMKKEYKKLILSRVMALR